MDATYRKLDDAAHAAGIAALDAIRAYSDVLLAKPRRSSEERAAARAARDVAMAQSSAALAARQAYVAAR
jgi:hypothetical protein